MATYVILSKIAADAIDEPKQFEKLADTVAQKIKSDCPNVVWKESYGTTGRFDVLDVIESPDLASVERAVMIIRTYGHATTETMVATPWAQFIESLGEKKAGATVGTA